MNDRPIDKGSAQSAPSDKSAAGYYRRAYAELLRSYERDQRLLWHYEYFELQMIRSQSLAALFQLLLQQASDYFELASVKLTLLDPDGSLQEVTTECLDNLPEHLEFTADETVLQALFPDGIKVRELPENDSSGVPRTAMLPLLRQGHLVGSLELCRRRENSMMQPRSSDRLTHFAAVAAICIENCSNRERLRIHSLIDVLTGVRNRRAFEESLLHEVARAVRTGQALTAMFVDLDHFKAVNDRFGHPCGDRVLTEIAANIGQMLRPTDLLSRYGGEEFVALLPACDQVQAQGIARRITMSVAALDFHDDNGEAFQLTCSVGFSSWLYPDSRDIDASDMARYLIARADQALYLAKQQGRNRSCHLPPDEFPDT